MKSDKERIKLLERKLSMIMDALEHEGLLTFLQCTESVCNDGYWPDGDTCGSCRGTGLKVLR